MESAGRFLGAGAIEYPWLFGCDNSYSLQGLVATGDQKISKRDIESYQRDVRESQWEWPYFA